jgi:hypothetical protein
MLIDTRTKRNGRTVVTAAAAAHATAKLEALKQSRGKTSAKPAKGAAKVKSEPVIVPPVTFDHAPKVAGPRQVKLLAQPAANPLTWTALSKDVNITISGLGSTRQFKRYPGKSFPMAAAVWKESPAEAERATKAAEKAAAKAKKSASGAALSL